MIIVCMSKEQRHEKAEQFRVQVAAQKQTPPPAHRNHAAETVIPPQRRQQPLLYQHPVKQISKSCSLTLLMHMVAVCIDRLTNN